MTHPVVVARARERERLIAAARAYVATVRERMGVAAAWVVGSVARGDFNVWSDIDVVLIAGDLPAELLERLDLFRDAPPKVQVAAYTPDEFESALTAGNPLVVETSASCAAAI